MALINKKHVRDFALKCSEDRAHHFSRVGEDFYVRCEAHLRKFIRDEVQKQPSLGQTIK